MGSETTGILSNKKAVVTGGTTGIGLAIAVALADAGADVIAAGIDESPTLEHAHVRQARLDVTDPVAIDQLVTGLDQLDILVNCAGIILRNREEFVVENFQRVLEVNLTGTMRMCVTCQSLLSETGGCVVNTASMLSFFGSGFVPGYSASKGGIAQLTKSLAIAWGPAGIRVNAVAPGWIQTALTQPLRDDPQRSRQLLDRTPLGRWGTPEDVAEVVVFLCSPAARFMTGVVLPVDGGYSIC